MAIGDKTDNAGPMYGFLIKGPLKGLQVQYLKLTKCSLKNIHSIQTFIWGSDRNLIVWPHDNFSLSWGSEQKNKQQ